MPSEVYGVVHLLRFLVKLPVLMSYASMDGVELAIIQGMSSTCLLGTMTLRALLAAVGIERP
eukprot:scaffold396_cov339-Prasinococcus_capsulatus_cf.AAC.6